MSVTSEEINYLIFRYLQESGFVHTGFSFQNESHIHKSEYRNANVQPGALVSVIQKGLLYMDLELQYLAMNFPSLSFTTYQNQDGTERECTGPVALIGPHRCDKQGKNQGGNKRDRKESKRPREQQQGRDKRLRTELDEDDKDDDPIVDTDQVEDVSSVEIMDAAEVKIIPASDAITLKGHTADVFVCSWSPTSPLLLASGDATARIWQIPSSTDDALLEPIVLKHLPALTDSNRDVTTMDWNASGTLLATGFYDGQARIWTQRGQLRYLMSQHRGPIFALKWNKKGNYILTGRDARQQHEFHTGAVLDVDWLDNTTFATSSSDGKVYVCKVDSSEPVKVFDGHKDEVNAVRWDPLGELLASCSDDKTAKIWTMSRDECLFDLTNHTEAVYDMTWAPHEASSKEPRILATASFDMTVRLWDARNGDNLRVLSRHTEAVYSVAFNPTGTHLATGSPDTTINIWRVQDGALVKTYQGEGGIFEVDWNSTGDKLAACVANGTLVVAHVKL
ncbi:WD40-repeat-containing domain protein [Lobosporangium transversale]|uniref:WD40-repeat-containing domain protein n=1 Tax=Lobosporangium transversale TaxID=64571 RepID=A0A1Y2GKN0_9FUNG|nr:WD40-repeat-containing domain protein [Lobosporangium transversale]XP_021879824.1 WD40-repeat-containing domain protein [Lobosporangium transversale]ORZ10967.1 WD40-repeat-containing domain protein [Lobosporangium transversale]ORZ11727.1 WD40-repeat-containing domain protein [Lobosporangium transversale]|eukprot:XP_021879484.1 WD40-repeat-containing domain protein [Lobosporangium transversale]